MRCAVLLQLSVYRGRGRPEELYRRRGRAARALRRAGVRPGGAAARTFPTEECFATPGRPAGGSTCRCGGSWRRSWSAVPWRSWGYPPGGRHCGGDGGPADGGGDADGDGALCCGTGMCCCQVPYGGEDLVPADCGGSTGCPCCLDPTAEQLEQADSPGAASRRRPDAGPGQAGRAAPVRRRARTPSDLGLPPCLESAAAGGEPDRSFWPPCGRRVPCGRSAAGGAVL